MKLLAALLLFTVVFEDTIQAQVKPIDQNGTYNPHAYQQWADKRESDASNKRASGGTSHANSSNTSSPSGKSSSGDDPYAKLSSPSVTKSSAYAVTHADSVYWFGEAGIERMKYEATADTRDQVFGYTNDLALVRKNGMYGFMDKSKAMVIPLKYEEATSFEDDGSAQVKKDGKWGMIDTHGDFIVPLQYDQLGPFYNDVSRAKFEGKWGFIDRKRNPVIPFEYQKIGGRAREGLIWAQKNDKFGFINMRGEVMIPFEYDIAGDFYEGLAPVWIKRKNGEFKKFYIDKDGKHHKEK
jgi:hypothetical protein